MDKTGGAWCPKQQVERGVREYLEVDLGDVYVLTGVETQGRYDRGRGQEYVEEYTIEYWRPGLGEWKQYSRWDGKQVSAPFDCRSRVTCIVEITLVALFCWVYGLHFWQPKRRCRCLASVL